MVEAGELPRKAEEREVTAESQERRQSGWACSQRRRMFSTYVMDTMTSIRGAETRVAVSNIAADYATVNIHSMHASREITQRRRGLELERVD